MVSKIEELFFENREQVLELLNTRPKDVSTSKKVMPNFLVIGAPKAGTTSMHEYLRQHPEIYMSPLKNPAFFIWEGKSREFFGRNVVNSLDSYHALFQYKKNEKAVGEISPGYLPDNTAPERIRRHIPEAKLIAILRQPAERAFSQFWFNRQIKTERFSNFEEALILEEAVMNGYSCDTPPKYIRGGFYYKQLMRYFEFFDKSQVKVIIYDDFLKNPSKVLHEIFLFLNVDANFTADVSKKYNVTRVTSAGIDEIIKTDTEYHTPSELPLIPIAIKTMLMKYYKEDIYKLQGLLNHDLSSWLL